MLRASTVMLLLRRFLFKLMNAPLCVSQNDDAATAPPTLQVQLGRKYL